MGKVTMSIYIDKNVFNEIENVWKKEQEKLLKNRKRISRNQVIEMIIKIGIKAYRYGFK